MAAWETDLLAKKLAQGSGGAVKFHQLGYPADARYINFLHDWALGASPCRTPDSPSRGAASGDRGKMPPYWGEEEQWLRERTPLIKRAARELSVQKRAELRTLKELGFDFESWKRGDEERGKKGNGGAGAGAVAVAVAGGDIQGTMKTP